MWPSSTCKREHRIVLIVYGSELDRTISLRHTVFVTCLCMQALPEYIVPDM